MKFIKKFNEAIKTKCQTPGVVYKTKIEDRNISIDLSLPKKLDISEEEAKLLEANIHNALELVLAQYFIK